MKKNTIYLILVLFFITAIAAIFIRYKLNKDNSEITFYELQERRGSLAQTQEWKATRTLFNNLSMAVRDNPKDKKSALALAALFIQEARVTGNYQYYDMAALRQVNTVLENDPNNFQALTFKALVYLSQHHFADGLVIAQKAQKINPYNSFIYGLLVDANVELGNYKDAVDNADKMVSIRPDLRSYSRISYLREIHGDYPGAIDAMKMAVDAGMPGDDATEWTRIQLGHLYENNGDLQNAAMQYTIALNERNDYAYAIAGLGHIAMANKNYTDAVLKYEQADSLVMDYSIKEELVDLYQLTGKNKKADSLSKLIIDAMNKEATSANNNGNMGHYSDKELAYAYLKINEIDKALNHALAEYNRRPKNIDVNETVAWVYYKRGSYKEAVPYINEALKTKSKNPYLLCRAGLIYIKGGDPNKGKVLIGEVLKNNPSITINLKEDCMAAIGK